MYACSKWGVAAALLCAGISSTFAAVRYDRAAVFFWDRGLVIERIVTVPFCFLQKDAEELADAWAREGRWALKVAVWRKMYAYRCRFLYTRDYHVWGNRLYQSIGPHATTDVWYIRTPQIEGVGYGILRDPRP